MDEPLHFYWWTPEQAVTTPLAAAWEQTATDSQRAIMRAIEEELGELEGSQCSQKG